MDLIFQSFILFAISAYILNYLASKKKLKPYEVAIFVLISLNLLTFIHELGHYITLTMFGCPAHFPTVWFMFGATGFECAEHDLKPTKWWIIAYAGAAFTYAVSYYLWKAFGKDSAWRLSALVGFMYGVLPNLIWHVPGTDAYFAVSVGFPPELATLIMIAAITHISWLVYKEIADISR